MNYYYIAVTLEVMILILIIAFIYWLVRKKEPIYAYQYHTPYQQQPSMRLARDSKQAGSIPISKSLPDRGSTSGSIITRTDSKNWTNLKR